MQRRDDANKVEGVAGFRITGRDSQGSFNPEVVTEATKAFWADWKSGLAQALTVSNGTISGAKILITAPKVQYRELNYGDRNGIRHPSQIYQIDDDSNRQR